MNGREKAERLGKDRVLTAENIIHALVLIGFAIFMVFVIYGLDSVVPGIHDAFHDFRHSAGFLCH